MKGLPKVKFCKYEIFIVLHELRNVHKGCKSFNIDLGMRPRLLSKNQTALSMPLGKVNTNSLISYFCSMMLEESNL